MFAVFIDTNILLHFKTFDELPWKKLAGDDFKLVFPPIILDELDKHKNHPNPKTAKRSRMIAGKLISFMKGQSSRLIAEVLRVRPAAATFEQYNLDPKHQDDCLLASIIEYMAANQGVSARLVTDDLMALARSETFGIQTIQLDEGLRLAEIPDEQTKAIERLKKENTQLKERIPKVDLFFEGKVQLLKIQLQANLKTREEIRQTEMAKVKAETPLMIISAEQPTKTTMEIIAQFSGGLLSNERKVAYNTKVGEYYQEYEQYLAAYYGFAIKRFQSVELRFMISNDGNVPAQDIDVWLHLPDGFKALEKRAKEPKKPEAPYRPKHNFDMEGIMPSFAPALSFHHSPAPINFNAPTIKKTNSYEITYHCRSLKHDMVNAFSRIYLQYDSFAAMQNFTIDYKLNIANVPEPVTGQLHVVFEKTEGK
ncbi:MAG: PIN domain-containing protein [Bacteroidota bacterium]